MIDIASQFGVPDYHLRLIIGRTRIDYDQTKEETNRKKHGYSLQSAVYLLRRRILPIDQPRMLTNGPLEKKASIVTK